MRLCGVGKTRGATWRLGRGTCKTRALLAPRAHTGRAQQNARASKVAREPLQIHRTRLETCRRLLDNLVWGKGKVHNTKPSTMPNLSMHTGCLRKCQRHLGSTWGGQNFKSGVSLDAREGGEVSLSKEETCQCKFCKTSILDRKNRA